MPTAKPTREIELVSFETFRRTTKRILSNSKQESDKQLAEFQARNAEKREEKKKR
jgi:hypothetical protein